MSETVLAFDVGARRIGVAVGNDLLRLAHPAAIVAADTADEGLAAIARLVAEWQPERLVVGIPLAVESAAVDRGAADDAEPGPTRESIGSGSARVGAPGRATKAPSPAWQRCERFAVAVGQRFGLPVERVDERYSSIDADRLHRDRRQAGLSRRAKALDDVAAEVILQRYFDALPSTAVS